MPEAKDIKFDTVYISRADTDNAVITITPENVNPDTVSANLSIIPPVQHINDVEVLTGQLCMVTKNNHISNIAFEINDKGELIVHGDDAKNYSINDDGDLIYTYR